MDIVSHLVFGRALAALPPRPARDRGLTAATVIGAIAPDADVVLMPFGWDRYLLWHQRGTHALVGTMAVAIVLACLLRGLLRLRRRDPPAAALRRLALAAWLGCLGHILLDLVSGGTIRVLAPFSTVPFGVAWMAMADPLIAVPLLLFFLAAWRWRRHARRLAIATMVVLAALVGLKEISRRMALAAYARATAAPRAGSGAAPAARAPNGRASASTASAASQAEASMPEAGHADAIDLVIVEGAWGSFTRWWAFDRAPTQLRVWEIDAWRGAARLLWTRDTRIADRSPRDAALVEASRRLDTVRHVHTLFELPFADVRARGRETDVLWADIRFCDATDCGLWFGGTFDEAGRAREQVVIVGTLRQTRPP